MGVACRSLKKQLFRRITPFTPQDAAGCSLEGDLNLEYPEEKEIIVIKDTEKQDRSKVYLASESILSNFRSPMLSLRILVQR